MKFPCIIYLLQNPAAGYETRTIIEKTDLPHPHAGELLILHDVYFSIKLVAHTPGEKYDFAVFVAPTNLHTELEYGP